MKGIANVSFISVLDRLGLKITLDTVSRNSLQTLFQRGSN